MKTEVPYAASSTAFQSAQSPQMAGTERSVRKVLLIDDNADAADMLACVFEAKGYTVITTYDGESGIASAASFLPDVILLDIGMPGMNGFDVVRTLRKTQHCGGTLIVAHSGYGLETDKQRAREAGFDAHFTKPLAFEEFQVLMRSHFGLAP
ncbi:response regulator [Noviherbaspirillum pedocola]|uniref:Response regulator n=1 Tax=Noviherbaspirillum pedocola TaxID=2801341 RepID=A0A934W676_9BURK|nr:response regulator [Noviherbaspirillum pedocola]MBK4735867.1 response regulator [Noviherbaspirillum pedocola]